MERRALAAIARHLEERDVRSKWDWAVRGYAMLIAAGLAGTGAFYYAQSAIKSTDFIRSIQLISHGDDAEWCRLANGQTVQGTSGAYFCAVPMPKFQELVEDDAVGE